MLDYHIYERKLEVRKIYLSVLMLLSIMFLTTACYSINLTNDPTKYISRILGIDLSRGKILKSMDSHGGFHGDGSTYIEMTFDDKESQAITEALKNNAEWNELPLTNNLNIAVYGKTDASKSIRSLVTNEGGKALIPMIDNGYYFFLDRHSKSKDAKDDADLLNRYSFNFTIAIYDAGDQMLYFYELDT